MSDELHLHVLLPHRGYLPSLLEPRAEGPFPLSTYLTMSGASIIHADTVIPRPPLLTHHRLEGASIVADANTQPIVIHGILIAEADPIAPAARWNLPSSIPSLHS